MKLRKLALNQAIEDSHNCIRECKKTLSGTKYQLYLNISDQFQLHEILYTAQNYCRYIKQYHKVRLQKKFGRLMNKYYKTHFERAPVVGRNDPNKLVTVLNPEDAPAHQEENEKELLALGPGFAVSRKINDKIIRDVELNLAQCSYKLKWMKKLGEQPDQSAVIEFKRSHPQLQSPFIATPPDVGVDIDLIMNKLSTFVVTTIRTSDVKVNLNRDQLAGFKSLKTRKDLQISKSDKSGDFVVSNINAYRNITINHIKTNEEVYRWIAPTRMRQGINLEVKCPTEITYNNQLENKRSQIERECNQVWSNICEQRGFGKKFARLFHSTNTTLPVLYTLTKTHKIPVDIDISTLKVPDIKVRPIISCSGSPIEKLSILATKIITPLLKFLPSHQENIHQHLETLRSMEPCDLTGLTFYTADVTALFTNVNVGTSINVVIEFAKECWDQINTYGFRLVDLHQIMETVLSNSFFTFNRRLYRQVFGAFIGCSISPPVAIIRVHALEKRSIYTDLHITAGIRLYYKRYVDDMGTLARSKDEAIRNCERISEEDQDKRIKWK